MDNPPTGTMSPGWIPLAHAKGQQETGVGGQAVQSIAVSPHVKVRVTPRGQGSIVRPHLPVGLSPWFGMTRTPGEG